MRPRSGTMPSMPQDGRHAHRLWRYLEEANDGANPGLMRLALKMATGTGKTVVALHRAVHLAECAGGSRVYLGTFSRSLARALRLMLGRQGLRSRIGGKQREALWAVFAQAQQALQARGLITGAEAMAALVDH